MWFFFLFMNEYMTRSEICFQSCFVQHMQYQISFVYVIYHLYKQLVFYEWMHLYIEWKWYGFNSHHFVQNIQFPMQVYAINHLQT